MGIKTLGLGGAILFLVGCAQGHCRLRAEQPTLEQPLAAAVEATPKTDVNGRIFVYKYDGSQQCKDGKQTSLDVMAKELGKITIFSSVKKRDNLMHIQVCGSPTGMANVYEISEKSLKDAESKGFKKWSFE